MRQTHACMLEPRCVWRPGSKDCLYQPLMNNKSYFNFCYHRLPCQAAKDISLPPISIISLTVCLIRCFVMDFWDASSKQFELTMQLDPWFFDPTQMWYLSKLVCVSFYLYGHFSSTKTWSRPLATKGVRHFSTISFFLVWPLSYKGFI